MSDSIFQGLQSGTKFRKSKHQAEIELFKKGQRSRVAQLSSHGPSSTLDFFEQDVKTSSHKEGKEHKARKPRDGDKLDEGSDSEPEEVESEEEEEEGVRLFEGVEAPKPDSSKAAEQQRELENQFRKRMGIKVKGKEPPAAMGEFTNIPKSFRRCRKQLLRNIEESAYKEPTPIQMQTLPAMLQGRDVLAVAPTGSGKTAAYLLPLLCLLWTARKKEGAPTAGPRALVLLPTRELTSQVQREAERLGKGLGLRIVILDRASAAGAAGKKEETEEEEKDSSSASDEEGSESGSDEEGLEANGNGEAGAKGQHKVKPKVQRRAPMVALEGRKGEIGLRVADAPRIHGRLPAVDVLISTPLRLLGVLRNAAGQLDSLSHLVFDEADHLFEMGYLSQVDEILESCPGDVRKGFFSATLPSGFESIAYQLVKEPLRITVGLRGAANKNVKQKLLFVGREQGKLLQMRQMIQQGLKPPVLVFVQSKDRAAQLCTELAFEGVAVDTLHAGRTQAERNDVVRRFRDGSVWILVTTDVLARGIDFKGVQCVINYDFPQSVVSYVHRIGRTGRAGRQGEAITFFTEDDMEMLRSIANVMKISGCDVPDWMLSLKKMSHSEKKLLKHKAPRRKRISHVKVSGKRKPRGDASANKRAKVKAPQE